MIYGKVKRSLFLLYVCPGLHLCVKSLAYKSIFGLFQTKIPSAGVLPYQRIRKLAVGKNKLTLRLCLYDFTRCVDRTLKVVRQKSAKDHAIILVNCIR